MIVNIKIHKYDFIIYLKRLKCSIINMIVLFKKSIFYSKILKKELLKRLERFIN